jgi:hypothetical protein
MEVVEVAMPASARGEPSWAEALGYVAVIAFVMGCLGLTAGLVAACDEATGVWTHAVITSINYESGQCTYDLGWAAATADCPNKPDRGQPLRVYVVTDSSTGHDLVRLREPSWGESAPWIGGSVGLCMLGAVLWRIGIRIERHQTDQPACDGGSPMRDGP